MPDDSSALAVVALGFAVFALVVVLAVAVRVGRLLRAYDSLVAGSDGTSFVDATGRQRAATDALRADVARVHAGLADLASRDGLRHVAVVRYDAFGDMGGMLSFSAALLDDAGDGLVLTSINGRNETRTYAKGVHGRASAQPLSPEEQEAITEAVGGERRASRADRRTAAGQGSLG